MGYIGVYLGLTLSQSVILFSFSALISVGVARAAKNLHAQALKRIFYTHTTFFDTNPLGRIINRFSRDQDVADNTLADAIRLFFISFATALGTFGLVSYSTNGGFLLGLVPLMILYYFIQDAYRKTARELKRLDALSKVDNYYKRLPLNFITIVTTILSCE